MRKFFSFVAAVLFAGSMMAEATAVYDWAGNVGTTALGKGGKVTESTVKIHENTDEVAAIKFEKSYVLADGHYLAIYPASGSFQAGDVLSVAIVFNNSDDTKYAQVDLRAADGDTRIWLSDSASTINGRTSAAEPIVQTYTLEADQDSLLIGRYGNTNMFITMLSVAREGEVTPTATTCAEVYNMAKNDVVDQLNDVVVTYSNGANVWVKDETAAMLIYLPSGFTNNFKAGDVLSGVAGVVDIYQTLVYEVKPSAAQADAITITEGEAPAAEEVETITAEDINEYVILKGAAIEGAFTSESKTSLNAVIGEDTITVYNNFKFAYTFEAGKLYDIVSVVSAYKGNPQVYFISAEEAAAEPIVINNLTYGMVFTEDFAEWGAVDILVTNQPIVGQQIVGDGYIVAFDILPENANDITGSYSALAENLDLEYSGITQIAGTDTTEIELADGVVSFQLGQYSIEAQAAQLALAAELEDVDGNIYHVSGAVVVYYEFLPEEQGVENVAAEQKKAIKKIEMGNVVIEKNGVRYNVNGAVVR